MSSYASAGIKAVLAYGLVWPVLWIPALGVPAWHRAMWLKLFPKDK